MLNPAEIKRFLNQMGQQVILQKQNLGAYDPTDSSSTNNARDVCFTGAFVNFKTDEIDGTIIKQGERKLILAAHEAEFVPDVKDKVKIGDNALTIQEVKSINPNGTPLAYICRVSGNA